jgi:hypothetical protein
VILTSDQTLEVINLALQNPDVFHLQLSRINYLLLFWASHTSTT